MEQIKSMPDVGTASSAIKRGKKTFHHWQILVLDKYLLQQGHAIQTRLMTAVPTCPVQHVTALPSKGDHGPSVQNMKGFF